MAEGKDDIKTEMKAFHTVTMDELKEQQKRMEARKLRRLGEKWLTEEMKKEF